MLLPLLAMAQSTQAPIPGFWINRELEFDTYITSMAAIPGEDALLFGTSEGLLFTYSTDGRGVVTYIDSFDVHDSPESGILSLAFHDDYPASPTLFAYMDLSYGADVALTLWKMDFEKVGDSFSISDRSVIKRVIDDTPERFYHQGGGLLSQGNALYLAIGDDFHGPNAQDLNNSRGKIHRMNINGGVLSDPPFPQQHSVLAYGIRNVYRMYEDPVGRIFFSDIGSSQFEELNLLKQGADYGWPKVEGIEEIKPEELGDNYNVPLFSLPHPGPFAGTLSAVCFMDGIVPVEAESYPPRWRKRHFIGDWNYNAGQIFALTPDANGEQFVRKELAHLTPSPVTDFAVSNGMIWYTTTFFHPDQYGLKQGEIWTLKYTAPVGSKALAIDALLEPTSNRSDNNADGIIDVADLI